jgi:CheY-like chemotaxis protein
MIRDMARSCLAGRGYRVIEVTNGAEALEWIECHDEPVDLLLTDLVMPRMDGRELAEALQKRYPNIRVLYMSGYPADVLGESDGFADDMAFLPKPFKLEDLLQHIRQLLDDPKAQH